MCKVMADLSGNILHSNLNLFLDIIQYYYEDKKESSGFKYNNSKRNRKVVSPLSSFVC
jgi:hypothetical protein